MIIDRRWMVVGLAVLAIGLAGCDDDGNGPIEPPALAFVGSATCGTSACHQSVYNRFVESGHPYKLTAVRNNQGPTYPWDAQHAGGGVVAEDGPPDGMPWSAFSHVIGGYGWKARWLKHDGFVHTGATAQLNLADGAWASYEAGNTKPYDYSCFKCHTTGASPDGEWQPGVAGTFVFGGIQCEACHGQGSRHAFDPQRYPVTINRRADACGECHSRDAQRRIAARNGFVRHHEQYDEFLHSPHKGLSCVTCHDPHASVVYDAVAAGEGVKTSAACTSCHQGYDTNNTHVVPAACTACHMPKTGVSAASLNAYRGDISSHVWNIDTRAVPKDSMFTPDGAFVRLDANDEAHTTLDFACYGCHKDQNGVGGSASIKTLDELAVKANGIHGGGRRTD